MGDLSFDFFTSFFSLLSENPSVNTVSRQSPALPPEPQSSFTSSLYSFPHSTNGSATSSSKESATAGAAVSTVNSAASARPSWIAGPASSSKKSLAESPNAEPVGFRWTFPHQQLN